MKIKIIDLYNIIAKGETPPKEIKYNDFIYNWDEDKYLHYSDEYSQEFNLLQGVITEMCLNDEVEIIEDKSEKIEKLNIKDNCLIDERGVGCH